MGPVQLDAATKMGGVGLAQIFVARLASRIATGRQNVTQDSDWSGHSATNAR